MPELFALDADSAEPRSYSELSRALPNTWVMIKRNLRSLKRTPEAFVFRLIQPVMFLLVFYYVAGGAIKIPGTGTMGSPTSCSR